ncbi:MAG: hypothetical protein VB012_03490 [Erysipelotrichaceae bacterium]|nr:hypothetical protein [Erysipelotrichaceae bacterium]
MGENGKNSEGRTSTLFNRLFKSSDLQSFLDNNAEEINLPSFSTYITQLCKDKQEVPERIIKRADLERSYGHQLFRGTRNPSRDTVIQLAFGFESDVEQAQQLLKHARMSSLYPRVKRDAAIIYCLHNGYKLVDVQMILNDLELPLIGGVSK